MKRTKPIITELEKKVRFYDQVLSDMIGSGQVSPSTAPTTLGRTIGECKQTKLEAIWKHHFDLLGSKRLIGIHFRRGPLLLPDKKRFGDWILGFQVQKSGFAWLYGNEEGTRPGIVTYVPVAADRKNHILSSLEGDSKHIRHLDPVPRDIRWFVPYSELISVILPTRVENLVILPTGAVLITMTSGQQMIWSADVQQTRPPILRWTK